MVPLAMALVKDKSDVTLPVSDIEVGTIEQAQDEKDNDKRTHVPVERNMAAAAFDEILDGMKLKSSVTASDHHIALYVCRLMSQLLGDSDFLALCSELCGVALDTFCTVDTLEYVCLVQAQEIIDKSQDSAWRAMLARLQIREVSPSGSYENKGSDVQIFEI